MKLLNNVKAIEKFVNATNNKAFKFENMTFESRKAERACKCVSCGETKPREQCNMFLIPQNNVVGVCLCDECRGTHNLKSYFDENTEKIGTPYKHTSNYYRITSSHELESIGRSSTARAALCYAGYIPTYDGSLAPNGIEYKSKICLSASPFGIMCNTIEFLNDYCQFSTRDERVGCHTHFGLCDNSIDFRAVDYSVFDGLHEYVKNMSVSDRIRFFGRDFAYYAEPTIAQCHESWINKEHEHTVEFRLCKFISAKQYMTCYYSLRDIFALALKYWEGKASKQETAETIVKQFDLWVRA